jgi:hypothetical protein
VDNAISIDEQQSTAIRINPKMQACFLVTLLSLIMENSGCWKGSFFKDVFGLTE